MITTKFCKTTFFLISLILVAKTTFSQKVLFEVKLSAKNFSTICVGDSILLRYDDISSESKINRSMWVTDSAVVRGNVTPKVFAAINYGDEVYYYDLQEKKELEY